MRRLLPLILFLCPLGLLAQSSFTIPVQNQAGTAITGATVTLTCTDAVNGCHGLGPFSATSSGGNANFTAIPAGNYTVTVTGTGIQSYSYAYTVGSQPNGGTANLSSLNSIIFVDGVTYPFTPDACASINNAISALPKQGAFASGVVDISGLAKASQPVACGSTVNAGSPYLWIRGPGSGSLTFNCTVTVAAGCFNTQMGAGFTVAHGKRLSGFAIKGQGSANANAVGIHAGDMVGALFDDIAIDGFTGTNSSCLWLDNVNGFTEENWFVKMWTGDINGVQVGCTKNVRFTNTAGTSGSASFSHNFFFSSTLTITTGTGLSLESGTYANEFWGFTGNASDGTTTFSLTGNAYSTGPASAFDGAAFITMECGPPATCTTAKIMNVAASNSVTLRAGEIVDISQTMLSTISGSYFTIPCDPGGAATASANMASPKCGPQGRIWNGSASVIDTIVAQILYGTGTNPIAKYTYTHPNGTSGAVYIDESALGATAVQELCIGGTPDLSGEACYIHGSGATTAGVTCANWGELITATGVQECNDNSGNKGIAGYSNAKLQLASGGSICTNGELALSAGWQSTGSATVTAVAGTGQTCSWTITTGTTTAANPTITDTLTNALPAATTRCWMFLEYGPASTHTAAAGEGFAQTTLSATVPVFTFNGTPTAAGKTYLVVRTCGP